MDQRGVAVTFQQLLDHPATPHMFTRMIRYYNDGNCDEHEVHSQCMWRLYRISQQDPQKELWGDGTEMLLFIAKQKCHDVYATSSRNEIRAKKREEAFQQTPEEGPWTLPWENYLVWLSPVQRETIEQIFFQGRMAKDIAEERGCMPKLVSYHKQKALHKLREIVPQPESYDYKRTS